MRPLGHRSYTLFLSPTLGIFFTSFQSFEYSAAWVITCQTKLSLSLVWYIEIVPLLLIILCKLSSGSRVVSTKKPSVTAKQNNQISCYKYFNVTSLCNLYAREMKSENFHVYGQWNNIPWELDRKSVLLPALFQLMKFL